MGAIVMAVVLSAGLNDLLTVQVNNSLIEQQKVVAEEQERTPVRQPTRTTRTRWGWLRRR